LQTLDHLLLLLEGGTLVVLKYSHVVQRFYIATELQLAPGMAQRQPCHLGVVARLSPCHKRPMHMYAE
jgi:hypothetical protein